MEAFQLSPEDRVWVEVNLDSPGAQYSGAEGKNWPDGKIASFD